MATEITKLDITLLTNAIKHMTRELENINHTLSLIDLEQLANSEIEVPLPPVPENILEDEDGHTYKTWYAKMHPKYKWLKYRLSISSDRELYSMLFNKFNKDNPNYNLNNVLDEYKERENISNCYTMDAIENTEEVRILFENLVNGLIQKYQQ